MTTLLIMTTGQTDVQLVKNDERCEFSKDCVGKLHDQLRHNPTHWAVDETPSHRGDPVESLPEENFTICTPKLDAALSWFASEQPDRLLILGTTRKSFKEDPRFAGEILSRRADELGIKDVIVSPYLEADDGWLEDRSNPIDAIVRREVVGRIERAIISAVDGVSKVVVAASGGMPEIKALVRELARLHTPQSVEFKSIEIGDGSRTNQPDVATARDNLDPVQVVRARWHALELIEKGNLLGAWGAVAHLQDKPGQNWVEVVKWLAHYASSLPLPTGCNLAILSHQRMAVRAALRVELSLCAGDIPRAVHGTVAFFEAALWDKLLEHFERDATDIRWLKLRAGAEAPVGKLLREGVDDDKNRPFESKSRPDGQVWFWFHESGAGRFARDYVKSEPLKKLLGAVDKVKLLRNDVAHNEPTTKLMDSAAEKMRAVQLWANQAGSNQNTFLTQPLVKDVLIELGVDNPEHLLESLLIEVRSRLRSVPEHDA